MLRACIALLLWHALVACRTAPPETDPVPDAGHEMATRLTGNGLQNLARVDANMYRGAQPTAEGYRQLRKMGIKTVISLRKFHSGRKAARAAGLGYYRIPIYAAIGSSAPKRSQVYKFFRLVRDPVNQPVFVHCKHGQDRTGTMLALYRIEYGGWTVAEAIEEMQAFGYNDIFVDLIEYVRQYK